MKRSNLNEVGVYLNRPNWEMVCDVNEIDDKVSAFTGTSSFLKKRCPNALYAFHPSDKPWMTRHIKQKIKSQQKVFT